MVMVEPMFCYCRFVWMSKAYVPVVLFYSGLYRSTSLSDVHLITFARYAVNFWSPEPQLILHRAKETGDFLRCSPTHLMFCLASILLSPSYVAWTYRRRETEVGFSSSLEVLTAGLKVCHICLVLQLILEAFLVTKSPGSVNQGRKNGLYVGGMVV